MASSPITIALRVVSPKYILTIGPLFGWLLRPPIQQEPSKSEAPSPSLFLFLFRSIRRPKRRVDGLPYAFHPFESSLQCPPIADAIIWLVVTSPCQMAAIKGRCSTRLSIFRWAPFRRPKQGENTQCARARAPGAFIRLIGSRDAAIQVHGGCFHGEGGQSRWR